jgi:hypothetical protein
LEEEQGGYACDGCLWHPDQQQKEIDGLMADYKLLYEALEKSEWYQGWCPVCHNFKYRGHSADCAVGIALASVKATP